MINTTNIKQFIRENYVKVDVYIIFLLTILIMQPLYPSINVLGYTVMTLYSMYKFRFSISDMITRILITTYKFIVEDVNKRCLDYYTGRTWKIETMISQFYKHKLGIAACFKTVHSATSSLQVVDELVKVGSMLGVEQTMFDKITGGLAKITSNIITTQITPNLTPNTIANFQPQGLVEDAIPLLGAGAAIIGTDLSGIKLDKFIQNQSKNIQAIENIYGQFKKIGVNCGFVKNENYAIVTEITNELVSCREQILMYKNYWQTKASNFFIPKIWNDFVKLRNHVEQLNKKIKMITNPQLKQHQSVMEFTKIINDLLELHSKILAMKTSAAIRPLPVAVCLKGPSQIGKTESLKEIMKRIKERLSTDPKYKNLFPDIEHATCWYEPADDEFETGYNGQFFHLYDDGFADKEYKDHKKWLNRITTLPCQTVQADLQSKGYPYQSSVALVTCNNFPTKSTKISNVDALQKRFQISAEVSVKQGHSVPKAGEALYDSTFSWLEYRVDTMENLINDKYAGKICGIDDIVDKIIERLIHQQEYFLSNINKENLEDVESVYDETELDLIEDMAFMFDISMESNNVKDYYDYFKNNIKNIPSSLVNKTKVYYNEIMLNSREFNINEIVTKLKNKMNKDIDYKSIIGLITTEKIINYNDSLPQVLKRQIRNCISNDIVTDFNQLEKWYRYMVKRDDPKVTFDKYQEMMGLSVDDILVRLSDWMVDPERVTEFNYYWNKQQIIQFNFDSKIFIWGPKLMKGLNIIELTEELKENLLLSDYTPEHLNHLFKSLKVQCIKVIPLVTCLTSCIYSNIKNYIPPKISNKIYNLGLVKRIYDLDLESYIQKSSNKLEDSWKYVINLSDKFSNTATGLVLSVLDNFGIDVSDYWYNIIRGTLTTATMTILLSLALFLIYSVYKILVIKSNENKVEEVKQQSVGEKVASRKINVKPITKLTPKLVQQSKGEKLPSRKINVHKVQKFKPQGNLTLTYDSFSHLMDNEFDSFELYHCSLNDESYVNEIESQQFSENYFKVVKEIIFVDDTEQPMIEIKGQFICDTKEEIEDFLIKFELLGIVDYILDIQISHVDKFYFKYNVCVLNSCLQEHLDVSHRSLTKLYKQHISNMLNEVVKPMDYSMSDVVFKFQHDSSILDNTKSFKNKHLVKVSLSHVEEFNTDFARAKSHGLGSKNYIFTNSHITLNFKFLKFWKVEEFKGRFVNYYIAKLIFKNTQRDLAVWEIITPKQFFELTTIKLTNCNLQNYYFSDISNLLLTEREWSLAVKNAYAYLYLPHNRITLPCRLDYSGSREVSIDNKIQSYDFLEVKDFKGEVDVAVNGDCGGFIMLSNGRCKGKIVGFHAGQTKNRFFGTILTKDDLLETGKFQHDVDTWNEFVLPGKPTDLPYGTEVKFIGKFPENILPANKVDRTNWWLSPFSDNFEEQLVPSVLSTSDKRVLEPIAVNRNGKPSLLIKSNSEMCNKQPLLDEDKLNWIKSNLISHISNELSGHIDTCSDNMDVLLDMALNGNPHWKYVKGIRTDTSAGLPWNQIGAPLKGSMIDKDLTTGHRTFKDNPLGQALRNRVIDRIVQGNRGIRRVAFTTSQLKDETIKKSKIVNGNTRVYYNVPVEVVLTDAALFGPFKEAYTSLGHKLWHSIGINVHSSQWRMLADKLRKHSNFMDVDFAHYDKKTHNQILELVMEIIIQVIENTAPDGFTEARRTQAKEAIYTWLVDFETVYETQRGNKSGGYLTTVINCLANIIYSLYVWLVVTGIYDFKTFLDNVEETDYGDDKLMSVSDEFADVFNYFAFKDVLTPLGHDITPGTKEGEETAFIPFEKLSFLKRGFKIDEEFVWAPLLKRSIEGPFVWTQIHNYETEIWVNLITEQLGEAALHGEEYYNEFKEKLSGCKVSQLRKDINSILLRDYNQAMVINKQRYYD